MRTTTLATLGALLALALPGHAQEGPGHTPVGGGPAPAASGPGPIAPNRPGFTNGSATIAPGDALAENGAALTRASSSQGDAYTADLPETNLRFGVTPSLEADVVLPDYFDVHNGTDGLGDAAVGVKYRCYQSRNGNTKASIAPSLTLPTHARFSSGQYDPTLLLGVQTASGARWSLASNLVLSDPTVAGSRDFTTTLSGSVSYALTPTLSAYFDSYYQVPRVGGASPVVDGGFADLVTPNIQLDAEYYQGLGGAAPVSVVAGGLSFRL